MNHSLIRKKQNKAHQFFPSYFFQKYIFPPRGIWVPEFCLFTHCFILRLPFLSNSRFLLHTEFKAKSRFYICSQFILVIMGIFFKKAITKVFAIYINLKKSRTYSLQISFLSAMKVKTLAYRLLSQSLTAEFLFRFSECKASIISSQCYRKLGQSRSFKIK